MRQERIPHTSDRRSSGALAHTRESPQPRARKTLLLPVIPAYPHSTRRRHARPVTPEVPVSETARASPMSVPASRQGYGASRARSSSLYVLQTDNTRRVRDGYISESTSGHARALATRSAEAICRTNVLANDRACAPVPSQNLHGKEGVDGSSPSEGFLRKALQNGLYCCLD
jgi:hypothetical protein